MITSSQVQDAVSASSYPWSVGDDVLYDLCGRSPDHADAKVVVAKLWLIGRAYSAAIERLGRADGLTTSRFYVQVAEALIGSDVDHHIRGLREFGHLNEANMPRVLEAHEYVVATIQTCTDKSPRSFASKYLHFHAPRVVPVFDGYAEKTIRNWMPGRLARPGISQLYDKEYSSFVARVLTALDKIEDEHGCRLTPKQIDRLLWIEGEARGE